MPSKKRPQLNETRTLPTQMKKNSTADDVSEDWLVTFELNESKAKFRDVFRLLDKMLSQVRFRFSKDGLSIYDNNASLTIMAGLTLSPSYFSRYQFFEDRSPDKEVVFTTYVSTIVTILNSAKDGALSVYVSSSTMLFVYKNASSDQHNRDQLTSLMCDDENYLPEDQQMPFMLNLDSSKFAEVCSELVRLKAETLKFTLTPTRFEISCQTIHHTGSRSFDLGNQIITENGNIGKEADVKQIIANCDQNEEEEYSVRILAADFEKLTKAAKSLDNQVQIMFKPEENVILRYVLGEVENERDTSYLTIWYAITTLNIDEQ